MKLKLGLLFLGILNASLFGQVDAKERTLPKFSLGTLPWLFNELKIDAGNIQFKQVIDGYEFTYIDSDTRIDLESNIGNQYELLWFTTKKPGATFLGLSIGMPEAEVVARWGKPPTRGNEATDSLTYTLKGNFVICQFDKGKLVEIDFSPME